ncbi:MAG: hypothetical protein AAFO07_10050 [Bacteroidota bacterium]
MRKFLRRLFVFLIIIFLLGLILSIVSTFIFQKQIGNTAIKSINESLKTELSYENISFNLFKNFPTATATFSGIRLKDTRDSNLLKAEELSLKIGLWGLINKNYNVSTAELSNGYINLLVDESGKPNFDIFKEGFAQKTNQLEVDVEKALLRNIDLKYINQSDVQELALTFKNAELSGDFSDQELQLESKGKLEAKKVSFSDKSFELSEAIDFETEVDFDFEKNALSFSSTQLSILDNLFRLNGDVEQWDQGTYYDLFLSSTQENASNIFALLPQSYQKQLEGLECIGNLTLSFSFKGLSNASQGPAIAADIKFLDGTIKSSQFTNVLENVSFNAMLNTADNKQQENSKFSIENFSAYYEEKAVDLNLEVQDFNRPLIDLSLNGILPTEVIRIINPKIQVDTTGGDVQISKLKIKGRLEDMKSPSWINQVESTGIINIENTTFLTTGSAVKVNYLSFNILDNRFNIDSLVMQIDSSDINVSGTTYNVLPILLADTLNTEQAELEFAIQLRSEKMYLDQVLRSIGVIAPSIDTTLNGKNAQVYIRERERISNYLKGSIQAKVDELHYDSLVGNSFDGQLEFLNTELQVSGQINAMNGQFEFESQTYLERLPRMEASIQTKDININTLFSQTSNLGQEVLTSDSISGNLNAKTFLELHWDENGKMRGDKLVVLSTIDIANGNIANYPALKKLAQNTGVKQLNPLQFDKLEGILEIRRTKAYFPLTLINNNDGLNIALTAERRLGGKSRYNLLMHTNLPYARSIKQTMNEIKPSRSLEEGFYNTYFTLYGNDDVYRVLPSARQVKADLERSKIRSNEVRTYLSNYFNEVNIPSIPTTWNDKKEIIDDPFADIAIIPQTDTIAIDTIQQEIKIDTIKNQIQRDTIK